jgi:hypothetical protein
MKPGPWWLNPLWSLRQQVEVVDGRLAGAGGHVLVVLCGSHVVQVGSAGRRRVVLIPCGGDVHVTR